MNKEDAPRQLANGDVVLHCPHLNSERRFPDGTHWILFHDKMKVTWTDEESRLPYTVNVSWIASCSRCVSNLAPRKKLKLDGWYHFTATMRDVRRYRDLVLNKDKMS